MMKQTNKDVTAARIREGRPAPSADPPTDAPGTTYGHDERRGRDGSKGSEYGWRGDQAGRGGDEANFADSERGRPGSIAPPNFDHECKGEEAMMNDDTLAGNWKQLKGKIREQWGKLTDDDIDVAAGKRDQIIGRLQERYGIARDEAERQWRDFESRNAPATTNRY